MAQITTGWRAILSAPIVYSTFQNVMGANRFRSDFVREHMRVNAGMRVLDIGCGPADLLAHLPDLDYWGFDISQRYIDQARKRFGKRGRFQCRQLQAADLAAMPEFDVVVAIGLLHHLDDAVAADVLALARQALAPGGRVLTVDPCFETPQHPVARYLVMHDRGQNVRTRSGYEALARPVFSHVDARVRHKSWIPYTHCIMECSD